jgi:GLPGLI family protein
MKISYSIIAFFYIIGFYSQTLKVDYTERRIIDNKKLASMPEFARGQALESHNYLLQYSRGVSLYKNSDGTSNTATLSKIAMPDVTEGDVKKKNETSYHIENKMIEKWYYKNFNSNELLFNFYSGKTFNGKDHLIPWDWKITQETKTINGFLCKKATSDAFGYFFTAWFTEDIPINAGPEKFDGLPGLILYVGTAHYEYAATAVKIEKNLFVIPVPVMPKDTVTMAEVDSYVKEGMSKLNSSSTTTTNGNTTTKRSTIIIK